MVKTKPTSIQQSTDKSDSAHIKQLIEDCGAVLYGHFRLASGRHSDIYVEKYRVLERPDILAEICKPIAEHFQSLQPDVIVGPQTGGVIVAYEVARQMGVPAVYVELKDGERKLARGAHLEPGTRALLVDDVLTTGVSLQEVLPVLNQAVVTIVGIGVLIDRSEREVPLPQKPFASCRFEAKSYAADELPDWLAEVPIKAPGTRASLKPAAH